MQHSSGLIHGHLALHFGWSGDMAMLSSQLASDNHKFRSVISQVLVKLFVWPTRRVSFGHLERARRMNTSCGVCALLRILTHEVVKHRHKRQEGEDQEDRQDAQLLGDYIGL